MLFLKVFVTFWHLASIGSDMWQYCRFDNLQFADVSINFRNFNIMPTRLAPFLQMFLVWVVILVVQPQKCLAALAQVFVPLQYKCTQHFDFQFLGLLFWAKAYGLTICQKAFVIPLVRFVPFFIQNLFYLFNRFSSMWQFHWWSLAHMNKVQFFTR